MDDQLIISAFTTALRGLRIKADKTRGDDPDRFERWRDRYLMRLREARTLEITRKMKRAAAALHLDRRPQPARLAHDRASHSRTIREQHGGIVGGEWHAGQNAAARLDGVIKSR